MECSVPIAVTAMAEAIAARTPNTTELALLGAAITQLGDTLNTIVAARLLQEQCEKQGKNNTSRQVSALL